jgi:hypothetical protein
MSTVEASIRNPAVSNTSGGKHLYSAMTDFLILGGGSILGLFAIRAFIGSDRDYALLLSLAFANIINNPHFANSYQIFYRNFRNKLTKYPAELRWRYAVAGIAVPIALALFFTSTIYFETPRLLGFGANCMFFLVGWHYSKQGYGMAMVDAALKRSFFSQNEKNALLYNAYSTWIFAWALTNYLLSESGSSYFGISYFSLALPISIVGVLGVISSLTTINVAWQLRKRYAGGKPIAWNGIFAYVVSLYVWLLVKDPIVLLWIPLFHSLQYLAVVWRFELNRTNQEPSTLRPSIKFGLFIALGMLMGYIGFWLLPQWLNDHVNYSKAIFGGSLFLYVFWIFINVHHYFLDTVMWRRGNPDVQKYLFSR